MHSLPHLPSYAKLADSSPSSSAPPTTFLRLQTLIVWGCLAPMVQLFQHCSTPALTTLVIEATFETHLGDFMQCLEAFGHNHRSKSCFRHFVLRLSSVSPPCTTTHGTTSKRTLDEVMRPLCVFRQMETVNLSLPLFWLVPLTHTSVERLVASWPSLLTLQLGYSHEPYLWSHTTGVTLTDMDDRTLVMIAERCPKLRALAMSIYGPRSGLAPSLIENCPRFECHPLQDLQLFGMQWERMGFEAGALWATLLDSLFPNLVLAEPSTVSSLQPRPGTFPYTLLLLIQCRQGARNGPVTY